MTIITNMNMGRTLSTDVEKPAIAAELANCVTAGTTTGSQALDIPEIYPDIDPEHKLWNVDVIIWTTTDAANAWVTFMNTFVPPPLSIVVQTV